ncbi:GH12440 [Drosophila grimshawi]|uniref:GH12440 n=2 Tax=Drosophila grimshawi TaxID=7222 RepID=B4JJ68_DROGR|nr:GH12440 [Drosophila grimshawi]
MDTEIRSSSNYYNNGQTLLPHRSNLLLQMLLQTNAYVSVIWSFSYLLHMIIWSFRLWNYTGLAMLLAYVLAVGTESLRLYASYSINLGIGATTMWLLLTLTPCVLLPALVYLRLAAALGDCWLQFISNVQLVLIALEALVALIHYALCTSSIREKQSRQLLMLKAKQL